MYLSYEGLTPLLGRVPASISLSMYTIALCVQFSYSRIRYNLSEMAISPKRFSCGTLAVWVRNEP